MKAAKNSSRTVTIPDYTESHPKKQHSSKELSGATAEFHAEGPDSVNVSSTDFRVCATVSSYSQLTLWKRAAIEKMIIIQLVRKFPALCGTQRFISIFTRARH
jgi:hypothetical protein